jgi:hypothetical protein
LKNGKQGLNTQTTMVQINMLEICYSNVYIKNEKLIIYRSLMEIHWRW